MKKKLSAILITALAVIIGCFALSVSAFDGNDYGGDWGGGDWGGGDWGGIYWGDDDYSGSGGYPLPGLFIGLGIVLVIIIISAISKKSKNHSGSNMPVPGSGTQGMNVILPDRTQQIESIIKQHDPNFTADDFTAFSKQVYIDIQTAWCKRDLTPVRPVLHTNLYNTTQRQVQEKIDRGIIYHYESMAINTAYLTSYVRDKEYEYLTVYLNARFIDYQTDEKTGKIIKGDTSTRWDLRYKMKFMRTMGVKTSSGQDNRTTGHNCPNCGAPMEITSSGQCAYCGSTVTTGIYAWVLSDFTTIRNDTKDDGIRIPSEPQNNTPDKPDNNDNGGSIGIQ